MWQRLTKIVLLEIAILALLSGLHGELNYKQQTGQCIERLCKVHLGVVNDRSPKLKAKTQVDKETTGIAKVSWYDRSVCGQRYGTTACTTASGEIFNDEDLTVAHKTLGFGVVVEFRNGDRVVSCRVNDRGPYIDGREFDLSYGCGSAIGIIKEGTPTLEYEIK